MNIPDHLPKLYYTMHEVCQMFDVNASLIRHWDKEFPSLKPRKNRKGDRRFTVDDIKELQKIYHLVKERGFTLDGAKKELSSPSVNYTKKSDITIIINELRQLKNRLILLRNRL